MRIVVKPSLYRRHRQIASGGYILYVRRGLKGAMYLKGEAICGGWLSAGFYGWHIVRLREGSQRGYSFLI